MTTLPWQSPGSARKDQALAYIKWRLIEDGHAPLVRELAGALGVGETRAKALISRLSRDRQIEVQTGVHRGIVVPGLEDEITLGRLKAAGWRVNGSDRTLTPPCPKEHLPLIDALDHIEGTGEAEKAA